MATPGNHPPANTDAETLSPEQWSALLASFPKQRWGQQGDGYWSYYPEGRLWTAIKQTINPPDPYTVFLPRLSSSTSNDASSGGNIITVSATERFGTVSSLYGPGNCICWFLLLLSVAVSWSSALLGDRPAARHGQPRKDSITNDFMAAITLPLVAVGHYLHQTLPALSLFIQEIKDSEAQQQPRPELTVDRVRFMAAIEAPLNICEDFIPWAALLFLLAARRGHVRKMTVVMVVGFLCVAVQGLHAIMFESMVLGKWAYPGASSYIESLLVRPYLFHVQPVFVFAVGWSLLTFIVYILEVVLDIVSLAAASAASAAATAQRREEADEEPGREPLEGRRRRGKEQKDTLPWSGMVSSWMSGFSAVIVGAASVIIKYGTFYPAEWRFHGFRFIPKSNVGITDLDQVVAVLGGFTTLMFSLYVGFKEWRAASVRSNSPLTSGR